MLHMALILGSAPVFFVLEWAIPLSSSLKKLVWLAPFFPFLWIGPDKRGGKWPDPLRELAYCPTQDTRIANSCAITFRLTLFGIWAIVRAT